MRPIIKIVDSGFAHTTYANYSLCRPNTYFDWVRNFKKEDIQPTDLLFFTDQSIYLADQYPKCRKVAWLIEPPDKQHSTYVWTEQNQGLFDYILTYEKSYLDKWGKNSKWTYYVAGGCWIPERDMGVHPKSKMLSTIMSSKQEVEHQRFRHYLKNHGYLTGCDIFGRGGHIPLPHDEDKALASKDYAFHLVIDQSQIEYGFTEKIIDCFATGAIPIYRGVQDVKKYFNEDGIIYFNTAEEFLKIKQSLTYELYYSKMAAIRDNYARVADFLVPEDLLFKNFISTLI